ncbi:MAG: restriction endonuclease subunit S [Chitinophagaceae bacterium]|nr:restriction endonuclease subunit S [Chitinophagaceae bacterium]
MMQQIEFNASEHKRFWISQYSQLEIPPPPLEIQQQIVAEIEGYQKIIDGAKQIVNHYKPTLSINPDWEMVELGEVCEKIQIGPFGTQLHKEDYVDFGIPIIKPKHIKDSIIHPQEMIAIDKAKTLPQYTLKEGDISMGRRGEMGRAAYIHAEQDGWFCGTGSLFVRLKGEYDGKLYSMFFSDSETVNYLEKSSKGVTMANLNLDIIQRLPIPKISLSEQQTIVKAIEEEIQLVNANKRLIQIFEEKIKTKIGQVWGVKEEETLSMAAEPEAKYLKR